MTKRTKMIARGVASLALASATLLFAAIAPMFQPDGRWYDSDLAYIALIVLIIGPVLYGSVQLDRSSLEEREPIGVRLIKLSADSWEVHVLYQRKWEPVWFCRGGSRSTVAWESQARDFYDSIAKRIQGATSANPTIIEEKLKT
mgnify:CR=1 FL=1